MKINNFICIVLVIFLTRNIDRIIDENKIYEKITLKNVSYLIDDTSWTEDYRVNTKRFISSLVKQAKSRKTLSKKQMDSAASIMQGLKKILIKMQIMLDLYAFFSVSYGVR